MKSEMDNKIELKVYYELYCLYNTPAEIRLVVKQKNFPYQKAKITLVNLFGESTKKKERLYRDLIEGGEFTMIDLLTEKIQEKSDDVENQKTMRELKKELLEITTDFTLTEDLWKLLKK